MQPDPLVPPQNLEAEESVLGSALLSPTAIDVCAPLIDPEDFYRESHATIWKAILRLHDTGKAVDIITVTDALDETGDLESVGGAPRIHTLAALVPATANVGHYARIVKETATLRGLIRAGGQIQRLGWERPGSIDELLLEAEDLVSELRGRVTLERDAVLTMHDAAVYLDEKFKNPPEEGAGIPTPWSFLPSFQGGRLYLLGGYTADGKTVQAAHFFRCAVAASVPSSLLSMEMSGEDMAERLAANMGLPAKRVQSGHLLPENQELARKVIGDMVRWGDTGHIWDAPSADIPAIRRHVKTVKPKFLIVDHLQQFAIRAEYERQDLEGVVRGLWQIAREFDITILLLAQLSRAQDKKNPFPRPTVAMLKGSALIEQLAWAVYFVWRTRNEANIATEKSEYIVAKNRSGPTGIRDLIFHDRETRFTELMRGDG